MQCYGVVNCACLWVQSALGCRISTPALCKYVPAADAFWLACQVAVGGACADWLPSLPALDGLRVAAVQNKVYSAMSAGHSMSWLYQLHSSLAHV